MKMIGCSGITEIIVKCRDHVSILIVITVVTSFFFLLCTGSGNARILTVDDDGDAEFTSIQDAVNASADGDIIRVYEGSYRETIIVNRSVSIIGNGTSATTIIGNRTDDAVNITCDGVEVSNFTIRGARYGILAEECHNHSFYDNQFLDNSIGIRMSFSGNNTIMDNMFINNSHGISGWFSHRNYLDNNSCIGGEKHGSSGIEFQNSDNLTLVNNVCSGFLWAGMNLFHGGNLTVENNTCFSNNFSGISLILTWNSTLRNNHMLNSGIRMGYSNISHWNTHDIDESNTLNARPIYYLVNSNTATFSESPGQIILGNCSGFTIQGLTFGMEIQPISIGHCRDLRIENCIFSDGWTGIDVLYSSGIEILNNTFTNFSTAVSIEDSNRNLISGNHFHENRWVGLELKDSQDNTVSHNEFLNNSQGISLQGSADNTIESNALKNQEWDGIRLSYSDNNSVQGNMLLNNTHHGLSLWSSDGNDISGNYFMMNSSGMYIESSDSNTITQNIFTRMRTGIYFWNVMPNTTIRYNDFYENSRYAIRTWNTTGPLIDAKYNYWGSSSGPYNHETNPGGEGDNVSNGVIISEWSGEPMVQSIELHVTSHENGANVEGITNISGTASDPISPIIIVQISFDGENWIEVSGTESWHYLLNTTELHDGNIKVQIRAFNERYYSETVTLSLNIENKEDDETIPGSFVFITVGILSVTFLGIALHREDLRYALYSLLTSPLYSRMERSDILDQATRNQIYTYITTKPGNTYSTMKRELGLGTSSLVYHLQVLNREGYIRSSKEMGRKYFFPRDRGHEFQPTSIPRLPLSPIQEDIINYLKEKGPGTRKEIEEGLALKRQTVSYSIRSLEKRGLVSAEGNGRNDRCMVVEEN